ncbi:MAG: Holliday junction branch migration protein RuvA [Nitriliruptoraceae bacterium]
MIAALSGTVSHRDLGTVIVDVGGVGYLVHVTPGTEVPARGQPVQLHTSLQVREESLTLYGFTERGELHLFELLLTSSGVGPKLALAALATHPPEVLRTAIAGGDEATLTAIPGVGRKVAQRLVLELRDKVGNIVGVQPGRDGATTTVSDPAVREEVRDALLGLGYSAVEVTASLAALDGEADQDSATLLRQALQHLGRGSSSSERT